MAPIEQVCHAERQPAGDCDIDTASEAAAVRTACIHRRARQYEEAGDVPSLERKLHDALASDHFADAGALDVDERRLRFNGDGFLEIAERHRDVDRGRGRDLQHDPGLRICAEPLEGHLQSIRPRGQVRYQVRALGISHDASDCSGLGLGHGNRGSGQHGAARISYLAGELRGRQLCERRSGQKKTEGHAAEVPQDAFDHGRLI